MIEDIPFIKNTYPLHLVGHKNQRYLIVSSVRLSLLYVFFNFRFIFVMLQ